MAVVAVRGAQIAVVLAETEPESATDHSLVFGPGEVAPWPIRVQCDLPGVVERAQFVARLGRLSLSAAELTAAVRRDQFAPSLEARRGLPLAGPQDTRLAVLDAAAEAFWRIWMAD